MGWDGGKTEVVVQRNAGGNGPAALRDILIFDSLFGSHMEEIAVVHHTDCGALRASEEDIASRIKSRLPKVQSRDVDQMRPFGVFTRYVGIFNSSSRIPTYLGTYIMSFVFCEYLPAYLFY